MKNMINRRIKISMVNDWIEYSKTMDQNNTPAWHILLSNCHKYSGWLEEAIENCIENRKGELKIMNDTD